MGKYVQTFASLLNFIPMKEEYTYKWLVLWFVALGL